jgi:hypothetical protein
MPCSSSAPPPLGLRSSRHAFAQSVVEPWSADDACVLDCPACRCLAIYIHNRPVRLLAGSSLDQASIDSRLRELRMRPMR